MSKPEYLNYRAQEALLETDDFDFLAMGRPEGPGCYCYANSVLRTAIDKLAKQYDYVIVDCEAGLEHFSRRTTGDIDVLLVLTDASLRSADTVFRVMDLVDDRKTHVGKKVVEVTRTAECPLPILERAKQHDVEIAGCIPDDPEVGMQWDGQTTGRTWGLIGAPGVSRSTRSNQHLFVNRRPIENRSLNRALMEGYHTALMKGQFPVCCLFIEIDPGEVDVNIHPAKREVKFHHERDVRRLLTQAVQETLLAFHSRKPASVPTPADEAVDMTPGSPSEIQTQQELGDEPVPAALGQAQSVAPQDVPVRATPLPAPADQADGAPVPLLHVPLRLVGVVGRVYVVLESDKGMVLMDQHAAHERVLYEQMLRRMESEGRAASQKLLLPETVELPPREARFLSGTMEILNRLGVGLSEFGERTFLLDALPPFVKTADARQFVLELVDKLQAAGEGVNALRLGEDVIAKTVCRHAVKANDALREEELQQLVDDLRRCEMPYTCPHGRPTIIEMNYLELEKKFGRIQ